LLRRRLSAELGSDVVNRQIFPLLIAVFAVGFVVWGRLASGNAAAAVPLEVAQVEATATASGHDAKIESGVHTSVENRFRAQDEWQGMPIDATADAPLCSRSADCGLARACIAGRCSACAGDADCASGERCVLQHCLVASAVECRSRSDCLRNGELCVLSDYSSGYRGNETMRSACLGATGPNPFFVDVALSPGHPADPPRMTNESVRARLEELSTEQNEASTQ
jgi:hypothetical protein